MEIPLFGIQLNDEAWAEYPPRHLPGSDEDTRQTSDALWEMYTRANRFRAAVALGAVGMQQEGLASDHGHSGPSKLWRQWASCGFSTAAMSVHDWEKAFDILKSSVRKNPLIGKRLDTTFKEVGIKFRSTFPHARGGRDSVAHPETYLTRDHSIGDEAARPLAEYGVGIHDSTVTIQETVLDGVFTVSFDGKLFQTPVTEQAADELQSYTKMIFAAVDNLSGS